MDSITHTLTGVVVAKAIKDEKVGNWGTVAGLTMGFFPDTDFVLGLFNRQFYLQYHRDFTHSLLLIPFYALFFSWLFVKISRRPFFWSFYKICLSVLVSHVILDLLTSYGTMILSPLSDHRFSWDLVFIVDLIFSGIIVFPLLISLFLRRKAPWICRGSLIGISLYIFFTWILHHQAIHLAKTFAHNLDQEVIQVASLPQPISPFRWANYVETKDKIYQGVVDLKGEYSQLLGTLTLPLSKLPFFKRYERYRRLDDLLQPPEKLVYRSWQRSDGSPWVKKALATNGVKFYYWFARFPVVMSVESGDGRHRVEFTDVRFFFPNVRVPFAYYVEFDDSGNIRSEGFAEN
ncbi:MAG: metal-dependent hydrolase [Thermodesulfobacteriota bacterium]